MKPGLGETQIDSLDPLKHQRLSVLFCSYSPVSANSPYFCVNPWYVSLINNALFDIGLFANLQSDSIQYFRVVNMDMYGRNDISLGMVCNEYYI